jgi:3-oxoadipate enol-lactonase
MLTLASRQAVADLAAGMLATRQMAAVLDPPVRVAANPNSDGTLPTANVIGACLGYPPLAAGDADPADLPFHEVVGRHLALADVADDLARIPPPAMPEVEAQARRTAAGDFTAFCEQVQVISPDGTPVLAYAAGDPAAPCVLLSAPCGMPARLVEPWMRRLAGERRVVTWESRGMFPSSDGFDGDTSVAAQVNDALAVLQALNLTDVHVAGLCGGAVVAAELATAAAAHVSSVSLWHGDFDLGELAAKTGHQRNLLGLMTMAAPSPDAAASIHRVVCQSMLDSVPDDLAAQLLYPYLTPQLFGLYSRLNSAIMQHDITATLPAVKMPVLVVTSRTDETAHPEGSVEVARRLPDGELIVREHGDHISLFRGEPELLSLLDEFLNSASPGRLR